MPHRDSADRAPAGSLAPDSLDPVRCFAGRLMLPEVQRQPTQTGQGGILAPIAVDVALQFRGPPLAVVLGHDDVLSASVPETAVDEDGNPCPAEADIRTSR